MTTSPKQSLPRCADCKEKLNPKRKTQYILDGREICNTCHDEYGDVLVRQ